MNVSQIIAKSKSEVINQEELQNSKILRSTLVFFHCTCGTIDSRQWRTFKKNSMCRKCTKYNGLSNNMKTVFRNKGYTLLSDWHPFKTIRYICDYGFLHKGSFKDVKKAFKNTSKCSLYKLSSGKTLRLRKFEHHALEFLFMLGYDMSHIELDRTKFPSVKYTDMNGTEVEYFANIFIPSKNVLIEVQESGTEKARYNEIKRTEALKKGYKYETWAFRWSNNGGSIFLNPSCTRIESIGDRVIHFNN